jgi:hypothetical protein
MMAKLEQALGPDEAPAALPMLALLWFSTLNEVRRHDHLVKGLLLAGSLLVIYGESNSGKTFFMLDLALSVCRGGLWRGHRTQRGLVLYIPLEGATSVRNRVAAYRLANPDVHGGIPFAIIPQAVDFLDTEAVGALIDTIRAAEAECGDKVVLVCIDTFARAVAGGDENTAKDVGLAVKCADRIRNETGACVAFVHHAGKDATKGARGSSALRAAVDTEILVEGQNGQRVATVTKQRDLESGQRMPFELLPVDIATDPDDGTPIRSCVVKHLDAEQVPTAVFAQMRGKAQRQLLAALRERAAATPDGIYTLADLRQIGKDIGLMKSTARYAVDVLASSPYMQPSVGGYRFTDGVSQ